MYQKKCPECGEYSYSANDRGIWRCSVCGADISDEEAETAEGRQKNEQKQD